MTQINGDVAVLLRYLQEHHPDINIPQDANLNKLLDIMEGVQAPLPNPKPAPSCSSRLRAQPKRVTYGRIGWSRKSMSP